MKVHAVLPLLALAAPVLAAPRRKRVFKVYDPSEIDRIENPNGSKPRLGKRILKKEQDPVKANGSMSISTDSPTVDPTDPPTTAEPTEPPTTMEPSESPTTSWPTKAPKTKKPKGTPAPSSAKPTETPTTSSPTAGPKDGPKDTPSPTTAPPAEDDTLSSVTPAPTEPVPVESGMTDAPISSPVVGAMEGTLPPVVNVTELAVETLPPSPAPDTPSPVTPAPVTPAPVSPAPTTPSPVTPAPTTPEPTEEEIAFSSSPSTSPVQKPTPELNAAVGGDVPNGAATLGRTLAAMATACVALFV